MKKFALISLCASMFALASCGGSSSTSTAVIAASLQTAVTPAYTDADTLAAFNAINTFRNSLGLGYWSQNTLLDTAAANHMKYSVLYDPTYMNDVEIATNSGYTGAQAIDRAVSAGYQNSTSTAVAGEFYSTGTGANIISGIVNTIYHRSGLMAQTTREVGIARNDISVGAASASTHWWISHGRLDNGQYNASNFTANYPTNGQTGVPLTMSPEPQVPFTDIVATQNTTNVGSPICFVTSQGTKITVTSFTITPANGSAALAARTLTIDNDVQKFLAPHEAYLLPTAPLQPNTTYNVSFTGSSYLAVYGVTTALSQTWSFTTGSN